jgi:hypothetical protein
MHRQVGRFLCAFRSLNTAVTIAAAVAGAGCSSNDGDDACAWLFAPASFVDAGKSGCTAEPSGPRCDPSDGRCSPACQSNEYLLTCRTKDVARVAIPERALQAQMDFTGCHSACNLLQTRGEGAEGEAIYCCQCGQRP